MRFSNFFAIAVVTSSLFGCGGGGGSSGTVGNGGVVSPSPVAADFVLELDKTTLLSASNEVATLTVTALDPSRNVVKDVPVAVSVDSGGVFSPPSIGVTDSAGRYVGVIAIGADKSNRTMKVSVTVSGITKNGTLTVKSPADVTADFIFELDKTVVVNTGTDIATLTITALDPARNVLASVPVSVEVDAGGVFTRTGGQVTDASGKFVGSIGVGADKSNRTITATISASGKTKTVSLVVTGAKISSTAVPATPSPGGPVVLNISTKDQLDGSISNSTLTFSGNAGVSGTVVTDATGNATKSFFAPSTPGSYTVTIAGLGTSTVQTIQVVDPVGGGIPAAVGVVSSASLSPAPSNVAPNSLNSSSNRARLNAKFLTPTNAGIENMRVRFEIAGSPLGAGESISTGLATVYSDASGVASADYIPGTRTSPTNGVQIRACYSNADFAIGTCPNERLTTLTVSGAPLSVSISEDNTIAKGLGGIAYIRKYLIQVNDAAGVAVKDAVVSVSVDITHYGKGLIWGNPYPTVVPNIKNPGANVSIPGDSSNPTATENIWCANEDINRNGFLDSSPVVEDKNGNGVLEPRKAEIIVSYVSGNKTDENGQMLVQTLYGQNMGRWLAFTLRASTAVAGSEGDASKFYTTEVLQGDVANGSFLVPPFGKGTCNDAF